MELSAESRFLANAVLSLIHNVLEVSGLTYP